MGKGQVKDKKSRLKMAAIISAVGVALSANLGLSIGGMVKSGQIKKDIEAQYKETEAYQEYLDEKNADIQARLDNNEITEEQAIDERKELYSWGAIQDSILKENPENAKYRDMLDEYNKYDTMRLFTLLAANVINIGFASYNIARLFKMNKKQKQIQNELEEKIKDREENEKIENERREGKQLDDYSENIKD